MAQKVKKVSNIRFCKKGVPNGLDESVAYRCRKHIHSLRNLVDYDIDLRAGERHCKQEGFCKEDLFFLEKIFCVNKQYLSLYVKLLEKVYEYLGSPIHQSVNQVDRSPSIFTDHGACHAYSVAFLVSDNIAKNLGCDLSPLESFILMCAAWIHDVGMFIDMPDFSIAEIRKNHGRTSGNVFHLIVKSLKLECQEQEEEGNDHVVGLRDIINDLEEHNIFLFISMVAASHQNVSWKNGIGIRFPRKKQGNKIVNTLDIEGCEATIRLDMLGDILKVADALDIQQARADKLFYNFLNNFYGAPAESSVFEWNLNNSMMEYEFKDNVIHYDFYFSGIFIDQILEYKKNDYNQSDISAVCDYIQDKFKQSFIRYIKLYLIDHYNTIFDSHVKKLLGVLGFEFSVVGINEGLKIRTETQIWKILNEGEDGNYDERKAITRRDYNKIEQGEYWVSSANKDFDLAIEFENLRNNIQEKGVTDIFLFLKDIETDKYRLYAGPKVYTDNAYRQYANSKNVKIENLGCEVLIPEKCGTIGYIAWTGCPELIETLRLDPRTSYSEHDRCLELEHVIILNLFDDSEDKLKRNGVLLFNYKLDQIEHPDMVDKFRTEIKPKLPSLTNRVYKDNQLLVDLYGNDFLEIYKGFLKYLRPHEIVKCSKLLEDERG